MVYACKDNIRDSLFDKLLYVCMIIRFGLAT